MAIKFRCTCGKVYNVAESFAGKAIVCKGCQKKLRIPGAKTPVPSPSDSFEFSNDLPERSPAGAAPPPIVSGRKKKKKPVEDQARAAPTAGRKTMLIAALALFGLLGAGGVGFIVMNSGGVGGGSSAEPPAPQRYAAFKSEHGGFQAEYPEGWEATQGGGTGGLPPWARFKDGTATISIKASLSGSAVSDIAGAGQMPGGLGDMDDDLSPVARVHDFQRSKVELDYSNYEEKPGENIQIPWGEIRMSEFTASEGFASKVQGYRVTLTGVQWTYNMVCTCPPRQWAEYQPLFEHVIRSISR